MTDEPRTEELPARLARLLGASMRTERLTRWPEPGEPGTFVIQCSCERWACMGTAGVVATASRNHDDAPWRNHVVGIYGRVAEDR